ncbi:MAG TPA: hypothetical protein VH500_01770 [Nitrososphaeraceae archaeon]|jgi:hypothetical protein
MNNKRYDIHSKSQNLGYDGFQQTDLNPFIGKVPYRDSSERMRMEQTIQELNKPYRLIDVLMDMRNAKNEYQQNKEYDRLEYYMI